MSKSILQQIENIAKTNNKSLCDIRNILDTELRDVRNRKIQEMAEANKNLVGKCFVYETEPRHGMFPRMKRYCKVLSHRSENEYRVECLMFYEHPFYWYDQKAHKIQQPGDWYLGEFDFDSFVVESIMAKTIMQRMTEISQKEYDEAAMRYTKALLEIPWCEEHYRFGGKLPIDDSWSQ